MVRMIYSSVPDKAITSLKGDKVALRIVLSENIGSFFTAKCLAGICNFPTKGSCVELRKAITELIEEESLPIIATSDGFSWTKNSDDLRVYAESLRLRIKGLERRICAVVGMI